MKRHLITGIIILLMAFRLLAIENYPAGARSTALSTAFVSVSDTWSTFHNQAGLATAEQFSAGIFFESKFIVDELSLAAGSVVLPTSTGVFGFSLFQFGKGTFKENRIGLAFARQLTKKVNAGIQLDYLLQTFPENSRSKGFATFEVGIIYYAMKHLFLGAHVFNPVMGGIETLEGKQKMPAIVRFGGHYQFQEMVMVIVEAQKDTENPLLLKTGIEFSPAQNLSLRFGVSGKPVNFTAGLGYTIKNITTDIGFSYHGNLGITPSLSIQISL